MTKPDVSTLRPSYDSDGKFKGMQPVAAPCGSIDLGLLEDSASVQVAISTVVNALATNRLDVRRATALLYGLQIAASNSRAMNKEDGPDPNEMIKETKHDSDGEPIADPKLSSDGRSTFLREAIERYRRIGLEPGLHGDGKEAADVSTAGAAKESSDPDPGPKDALSDEGKNNEVNGGGPDAIYYECSSVSCGDLQSPGQTAIVKVSSERVTRL